MSVRPCVRVSVRPRVRPASLPVSPGRPVLLLKTTYGKKNVKDHLRRLNLDAIFLISSSALGSLRAKKWLIHFFL